MGGLNHNSIDIGDIDVRPSEFPVESNSESVPDSDTTLIKSMYDDKTDHLLEISHSEHDEYILDIDIQILQALLVFAPPSKIYTVSTVLFHKYGGTNVVVKNVMLHFSMFVPARPL